MSTGRFVTVYRNSILLALYFEKKIFALAAKNAKERVARWQQQFFHRIMMEKNRLRQRFLQIHRGSGLYEWSCSHRDMAVLSWDAKAWLDVWVLLQFVQMKSLPNCSRVQTLESNQNPTWSLYGLAAVRVEDFEFSCRDTTVLWGTCYSVVQSHDHCIGLWAVSCSKKPLSALQSRDPIGEDALQLSVQFIRFGAGVPNNEIQWSTRLCAIVTAVMFWICTATGKWLKWSTIVSR